VPKFQISQNLMRKCNLCYDRTSQGKGPMCATVCPTQAVFYGTYEEFVAAGRAKQGAKPVNQFSFGKQMVRTRNYVVLSEAEETLDLMAVAEEAQFGYLVDMPAPTRSAAPWVDAETAGVPTRVAPPHPWMPRTSEPMPAPTPQREKAPATS
jgi:hypothetical protein